MKFEFERLGNIFSPIDFTDLKFPLSHAANPIIVNVGENKGRVFFNSRDSKNRSSVYSFDLEFGSFKVIQGTLKSQIQLEETMSYYRDGISLGSLYEKGQEKWIGFMAWINPGDDHWTGTIGRFQLDTNLNAGLVERNPWFGLDHNDPVSLSYPAFYTSGSKHHMWYGSTVTWDAGNGEMIHILKEKISADGQNYILSGREVEWEINEAQAFSRPSLIPYKSGQLMAFSFRGNESKYRIGFGFLDSETEKTSEPIKKIAKFEPSSEDWEDEMVEYPYLFLHNEEIYMLYNGNGYGKTGIGLARIKIG